MDPTPINPKFLLPGDNFLPAERFRELTSEEAALRHRLELKVERALYRAIVGLKEMGNCDDSAQSLLARMWGNEQQVEFSLSEAKKALVELQNRQLYRSTHHCFNHYLSERFGWSREEIYPEAARLSGYKGL